MDLPTLRAYTPRASFSETHVGNLPQDSERLMDLGERAAALYAARLKPSRWYCDREDCDGEPHDAWVFCNCTGPHKPSCRHARGSQCPPPGDWLTWLFSGGRGTGKTRAGAEWVLDQVWNQGKMRIALVARTPADARDVMIYGDSGIMAISTEEQRPQHEPTKRRLIWPNGAQAWTYSAAAPAQLRGPQHDAAWADETAAWDDARKGDVLDTSWNNLMLGLRVGDDPRCCVTTTPKRTKLIRQLMGRVSTRITTDTTFSNLENLAPSFKESVLAAYEGTTIGRQELMGEYLEDVEGALWQLERIEELRIEEVDLGDLTRIVVAVDPSVTSGDNSDETGIIVVGKGPHRPETCGIANCTGHGYVLADYSLKASPDKWAARVVEAYDQFKADRVVAEGNMGQELVDEVLRTRAPGLPLTRVNARVGKRTRAEPVAALYEQGRAHHCGPSINFASLEDQLVTWAPDSRESPDRLDALVWAFTELGLAGGHQGEAFLQMWEKEAQKQSRSTQEPKQMPNDNAPTLRPGCKHRWWDDKCVHCGGAKPTEE